MTDRELLELAAKAAGWTGWQSKHGYWNLTSPEGETSVRCSEWTDWHRYDPDTGKLREGPTFADAISETDWSPLTDDGDALRLAVKLEIDLCYGANYVIADGVQEPTVNNANDPCSATRRAIVRAAVEVGRVEP
jgi:hypothetical protein